jgi:hypothetical protein
MAVARKGGRRVEDLEMGEVFSRQTDTAKTLAPLADNSKDPRRRPSLADSFDSHRLAEERADEDQPRGQVGRWAHAVALCA